MKPFLINLSLSIILQAAALYFNSIYIAFFLGTLFGCVGFLVNKLVDEGVL